jgi:hypothetical protein
VIEPGVPGEESHLGAGTQSLGDSLGAYIKGAAGHGERWTSTGDMEVLGRLESVQPRSY